MAARIEVLHGARATEARLFALLDQWLAIDRCGDPYTLATPVRVVVPSRSLRRHLGRAYLHHRGGKAVAGLAIDTHFGIARTLAAHADPAAVGADHTEALVPLLVERLARSTRALDPLGELDDGFDVAVATVRDLRDAGFEASHAEAVAEWLGTEGRELAGEQPSERALALATIAGRLDEQLERWGLVDRVGLLRSAARRVRNRPGTLPTRGLVVHGFADATGVVTDFLEALLRAYDGTALLDQPPDPAIEGAFEHAFGTRFTLRLSPLASPVVTDTPAPSPPTVAFLAAADPDEEAMAVAARLRGHLEQGAAPEGMAIVLRDPGLYTLSIRKALDDQGVPYSGLGIEGPLSATGRQLAALVTLLEQGGDTTIERWLDLRLQGGGADAPASTEALAGTEALSLPEPAADPLYVERNEPAGKPASPPRVTFYERGFKRLRDLPAAPSAHGPAEDPIETLREAGVALAGAFDDWPLDQRAPFSDHRTRLVSVLDRHLGWHPDREARKMVDEACDTLGASLPEQLEITRKELLRLLTHHLSRKQRVPLGGAGGGVQVLSATEARGRTFAHLAVMGLMRDVFPRVVTEDPLLLDGMRRALRRLLPDLPIKRHGVDEERYLFAQLSSASPNLILSLGREDRQGRTRPMSPLLARLPLASDPPGEHPSPAVTSPAVRERVIVAARDGERHQLAPLLAIAMAEARADAHLGHRGETGGATPADTPMQWYGAEPAAWARSRVATLEEWDPEPHTESGRARRTRLGPQFGFVGPPDRDDPRRAPPSITTLEGLAACPWQTFLTRLLGIRPLPDPLASLPSLDAMLVGQLVHRVLEHIAGAPRGGHRHLPSWPADEDFEALLDVEAERLLGRRGLVLPGLQRAVAMRARVFLEVARAQDWRQPPPVEAVERPAVAEVRVDGRPRAIRLRLDRVDRPGAARLDVTDYKTGAPWFRAARDQSAMRKALLAATASGSKLQVTAALRALDHPSAGGTAPRVQSRYLFLRPSLDPALRVIAGAGHDRALLAAFDQAAAVLFGVWDRGLFFPRLVEPDDDVEPSRCRRCPVAQGCQRRDSAARGRLRERVEQAGIEPSDQRALRDAWWLPRATGDGVSA